jgi:hypothetical protein
LLQTIEELVVYRLVLKKSRNYIGNDEIVSRVLLNAICRSFGSLSFFSSLINLSIFCLIAIFFLTFYWWEGLNKSNEVSLLDFEVGSEEFLQITNISFVHAVDSLLFDQFPWIRVFIEFTYLIKILSLTFSFRLVNYSYFICQFLVGCIRLKPQDKSLLLVFLLKH